MWQMTTVVISVVVGALGITKKLGTEKQIHEIPGKSNLQDWRTQTTYCLTH